MFACTAYSRPSARRADNITYTVLYTADTLSLREYRGDAHRAGRGDGFVKYCPANGQRSVQTFDVRRPTSVNGSGERENTAPTHKFPYPTPDFTRLRATRQT